MSYIFTAVTILENLLSTPSMLLIILFRCYIFHIMIFVYYTYFDLLSIQYLLAGESRPLLALVVIPVIIIIVIVVIIVVLLIIRKYVFECERVQLYK